MKNKNAISPTRSQDYPEWYQQVVKAADLAESSPVRGCMVIKPWGYAVWENMKSELDRMFKETGHENAYFPLLIPLSFLEKEAEHVEGFAKECAVVTHHRLEKGQDGGLVPKGSLEEPLIIRPTSETIIGHSYSRWVQSYRDLPILINQWANVMRWEMRPRVFLRTSEFLWQEGHTVHATSEEAVEETLKMLNIYAAFAEEWMAVPVLKGKKTSDEKFPGAVDTYTIEAMMQDKKAIQAGTSHFLGQNFAKASEIKFINENEKQVYAWTTSWGVTTRLIGGLIMTHGDDDGLILPPKLAPLHLVILPIYKNDDEKKEVVDVCSTLVKDLSLLSYNGSKIRVKLDLRQLRGGEKKWGYIKKGVPLICEIGPRDLEKKQVALTVRNKLVAGKSFVSIDSFLAEVSAILAEFQEGLLNTAKENLKSNIKCIGSLEDFEKFFTDSKGGGFALSHWSEKAIGHEIFQRLKVTPRCLPLDKEYLPVNYHENGTCIFSGDSNGKAVIFSKAY
ncbi:MAG: proline--tRNA ligase [Zetaproteobacteria bacterium]|nr:proline--tRNA ligase [Pseudobdellovibrionaceae bacterium]